MYPETYTTHPKNGQVGESGDTHHEWVDAPPPPDTNLPLTWIKKRARTSKLDRPVRDDLVCVHVCVGARAGLPYGDRELIIQLALDYLRGSVGGCVSE